MKEKPVKEEAQDANQVVKLAMDTEDILQDEVARKQKYDSRTLYVRFSDQLPDTQEQIKALDTDIKFIRTPRTSAKGRKGIVYAFLEFEDHETCKKAMNRLATTKYKGKELYVNFVGENSKNKAGAGPRIRKVSLTRLFVVGLTPGVTETSLKDMFPKACSANIPKKSRCKGTSFGFVQFSTPGDAKAAYDASKDLDINGNKITVLFANEEVQNEEKLKMKVEKRKARKEMRKSRKDEEKTEAGVENAKEEDKTLVTFGKTKKGKKKKAKKEAKKAVKKLHVEDPIIKKELIMESPTGGMSDSTAPKVKEANKPSKPADHPPYTTMVADAIKGLGSKKGSSRQAILKYVVANNKVDAARAALRVRKTLAKMVASKKVVAAGAAGKKGAGSFKLGVEPKSEEKEMKKQRVEEPIIKQELIIKEEKEAVVKLHVEEPIIKQELVIKEEKWAVEELHVEVPIIKQELLIKEEKEVEKRLKDEEPVKGKVTLKRKMVEEKVDKA